VNNGIDVSECCREGRCLSEVKVHLAMLTNGAVTASTTQNEFKARKLL
jgi:hypothetical protein